MTVRHSVRFLSLIISSAAAAYAMQPVTLFAQPTPAAADAVQQPYDAVLNDDNVYVRVGPSDSYYATMKLSKGAKVTVVATRNNWAKIVPPEGSFCFVARAYVEKRGDGTVGRVTKPDLFVRAGSSLNGLKKAVVTSLSEGDDVKILGEQDDYFKIAPPPGAYLYVMKSFLDPAPQAAAQPIVASDRTAGPTAAAATPVPPVVPPTPAPIAKASIPPAMIASLPVAPPAPVVSATPATPAPPAAGVVTAAPPATQPAVAMVSPSTQPIAMAPATQPAGPTAEEKFDAAESGFQQATGQPLDKQPVDQLLAKYTDVAGDPALPVSMKRIAELRIATLKVRADAREQYVEALKIQADAHARQTALKVENDELAEKIKSQQVSIYTALGTLRISSLQQSGTTLYRLTDPGTMRTLLYIKSNDPKYAGLLNQFVGVKGDITEDTNMNLKFIAPTAVDTVDEAKVNTTVTATVIPPSLLTKTATASAGN